MRLSAKRFHATGISARGASQKQYFTPATPTYLINLELACHFFQPPVPVPHLVPAAFQFPKLAAPHPSLHIAFIQLARLRTGIFPQSFVKLGPRHQPAGCTAPTHQVHVKFLQPVVILHHLVIFQSGVLVTLLPVLRPRIDQTVIQRTGNRRGRRGCQPSGG